MSEDDILPPMEAFLTQSPELIPLQGDLKKLWNKISLLPITPVGDVIEIQTDLPATSSQLENSDPLILANLAPNDLIAIHKKNRQQETLTIRQLQSSPVLQTRYPKRPFLFVHDHQSSIGPSPIYMEKWPHGYRIDQSNQQYSVNGHLPVDPDSYYHQGEIEVRKLTEEIAQSARQLASMRETEKAKRMASRVSQG